MGQGRVPEPAGRGRPVGVLRAVEVPEPLRSGEGTVAGDRKRKVKGLGLVLRPGLSRLGVESPGRGNDSTPLQ